jgi:hypothetical protein
MIAESEYKAYFESLATKHIAIAHSNADKAFFYIDNPYELSTIDDALGYISKRICVLVDVPERLINDNNSTNYVDKISCQFTILKRESDKTLLVEARDSVLPIVEDFLVRIRQNQSAGTLFGDNKNRMKIDNVKIDPVGPMKLEWYGYTAIVTIICPFAPAVNDANWLP